MSDELYRAMFDDGLIVEGDPVTPPVDTPDRIAELEAQAQMVLNREAATCARHDAKVEKLEAQIADLPALAAVAMREAAAQLCDKEAQRRSQIQATATSPLRGLGLMHGQVSEALKARAAAIRALPIPGHAALLRAALELPEVRAVVEALSDMVVVAEKDGWPEALTGRQLIYRAALAALEGKQ